MFSSPVVAAHRLGWTVISQLLLWSIVVHRSAAGSRRGVIPERPVALDHPVAIRSDAMAERVGVPLDAIGKDDMVRHDGRAQTEQNLQRGAVVEDDGTGKPAGPFWVYIVGDPERLAPEPPDERVGKGNLRSLILGLDRHDDLDGLAEQPSS